MGGREYVLAMLIIVIMFHSSLNVKALIPPTSTLTEFSLPTPYSNPLGIATDLDDNVWFTENFGNKLARLDVRNDFLTEWNVPTAGAEPENIFVKMFPYETIYEFDIQAYFTESAKDKIARFDYSTNNFTEWDLPPLSNPGEITVDNNNVIWFTESGRDSIGRLDPSTNQLTEWILPGATSTPGSPNLKPWGIYLQAVETPNYENQFV